MGRVDGRKNYEEGCKSSVELIGVHQTVDRKLILWQ
jgi:hypothetical protein